ncbi:hypothetical protein L873DRAFT_1812066 [Choiromyces venosus 120613-1]|uniref:Uncharacterized protein n=1 Tax=Choiromyces venosus 120613-1 TaxID=1336337 RepID=A0A3N4JCH7_9PEZI|nr:hypothetical protein L873DRAFT_1812066 [Choiromyces venosus 120613-1]
MDCHSQFVFQCRKLKRSYRKLTCNKEGLEFHTWCYFIFKLILFAFAVLEREKRNTVLG